MARQQNSADLDEGLTNLEKEILQDEMDRRSARVSSYTNTDVEEEFIADTQEDHATFTSTSSNLNPDEGFSNSAQEYQYYEDTYNFWNFPPGMVF
ncbi:unnamed protein product [Lactuca saligna]|uniref:Uncharacterized protein n=1 Tax=Lactuca saligna TaxID=75948 RepID=A0AA36ENH6_LACSI|nr:unnamed protein product [Lactuca saligna]